MSDSTALGEDEEIDAESAEREEESEEDAE